MKEKLLLEIRKAAQWAYDDANDAGETHNDEGVEFDSYTALREALEAYNAFEKENPS